MTERSAVASASAESLSPEMQQRLVDVLEKYVEEIERGFAPDADALIAEHPDLAEPLRAHLANLRLLYQLGAPTPLAADDRSSAPDFSQKQLGDYRLLREVGRGGMGLVYEAVQISLDRRVAIKVLPFAAVLDQKQIERFKTEARAAAQLHHPNIVPVFSVGCERGVHYYAMQYVEGQSLDVAIRELRHGMPPEGIHGAPTDAERLSTVAQTGVPASRAGFARCDRRSALLFDSYRTPSYPRAVAQLGIQVAEALHYAHEYGIIHRDVKPSNLLLDGQGKVWITDFGLARFQADARVTMTGDVVGTLRYMSPEQAAGRSGAIDERTDVYSLGITLYELLTLRDAFEGTDGQDLTRRILHDAPLAPRRVSPSIPLDLETIVLKAISKSREHRYDTARQLADDLRRFLEGKPTLARRPTLFDRAGKWARRHRTAVRFALALAAVAFVALAISTLAIARAHWQVKAANASLADALGESERNRRIAQESLAQARSHFNQAREVVDLFGTQYADRLAKIPGAEQIRQEILTDALGYYRGFIAEAADDPTFQGDLALTYAKVGSVTEQTGDPARALVAYRQAQTILETLVRERPDAEKPRAQLATCHNNAGQVLMRQGKIAEARASHRRAIEIQKSLVEQFPDDEYRGDLALSYNNLGEVESRASAIEAADEDYREAIRIQKDLVEAHPTKARYLRDLALSCNNLSVLHGKTDPDEAIRWCREALAIQNRLVESHPDIAAYQSDLALSHSNLGALQSHWGRLEEAGASYREAIRVQEQLVRKAPAVSDFRLNLAVTYNNLGRVASKSQQWEQADASFSKASFLLEGLVHDYPNEVDYHSTLGGVLNNRGMALEKLGRQHEAVDAFREAIEHQQLALEAAPKVARYREFLSKQYWNYGQALRSLGRAEEAGEVALARQRLWPGDPQRLFGVACELAMAAGDLEAGRVDLDREAARAKRDLAVAAVASLEQAVEAGFDDPRAIEANPAFDGIRPFPEFRELMRKLAQTENTP